MIKLVEADTYLALDVFLLVLIIVGLHAHLQFLDELLLGVFVCTNKSISGLAK